MLDVWGMVNNRFNELINLVRVFRNVRIFLWELRNVSFVFVRGVLRFYELLWDVLKFYFNKVWILGFRGF